MRFTALLSVENTKLWKRLSTKVMLLILVAIIILATSVARYHQQMVGQDVYKAPQAAAGWRTELTQEIKGARQEIKQIEAGKNNFSQRSMIGGLERTVAVDQYRLDHNISLEKPFSIWTQITGFENNAGYGAIIALMLIIACSAVIAGEFSEGTIKMAVSRPYKRHEILSAKLIVTLFYGLFLLLVAIAANILMFSILYGVHGINAYEMFYTGSKVIYIPAFLKMLAIFGLDFLQVIFFTAIAFALSSITRSRSIATGFSLFMLLFGTSIAQMVGVYFSWGRYLPFALTNFSFMLTNGTMIEGATLAMALILTGIYAAAATFMGYFVFAKRDI